MNSAAVSRFEEAGFALVPDILDEDEVCEISHQLEPLGTANAGTRRLLNEAWCRGLGGRIVDVFGDWRVWMRTIGPFPAKNGHMFVLQAAWDLIQYDDQPHEPELNHKWASHLPVLCPDCGVFGHQ